jgi:hypothetical protein
LKKSNNPHEVWNDKKEKVRKKDKGGTKDGCPAKLHLAQAAPAGHALESRE